MVYHGKSALRILHPSGNRKSIDFRKASGWVGIRMLPRAYRNIGRPDSLWVPYATPQFQVAVNWMPKKATFDAKLYVLFA